MFFDNLEDVFNIAEKVGFSIFILPNSVIDSVAQTKKLIKTAGPALALPKNSQLITPNEKNHISVEQIRDLEASLQAKQTAARFAVIKHAEALTLAAENSALKLLEEPKENYHLVFLAPSLSSFLPTVLSRAAVYVYKTEKPIDRPPEVDDATKDLAKRLITVNSRTLPALVADLIDKKRKHPREDALKIVETAIELIYKSYFKTGNAKLLKRLPNLLTLHENLSANGHLKLQIYANLC